MTTPIPYTPYTPYSSWHLFIAHIDYEITGGSIKLAKDLNSKGELVLYNVQTYSLLHYIPSSEGSPTKLLSFDKLILVPRGSYMSDLISRNKKS
jgi:hypothetical protein